MGTYSFGAVVFTLKAEVSSEVLVIVMIEVLGLVRGAIPHSLVHPQFFYLGKDRCYRCLFTVRVVECS